MVTGTVAIDLAVDGSNVTGHVYFQWVPIGAIAGEASLEGTVDCAGGVRVTREDGRWGLPRPKAADAAPTVLPTGTVTGTITADAVRGSPNVLTGQFDYLSAPVSVSATCVGSYTATLRP